MLMLKKAIHTARKIWLQWWGPSFGTDNKRTRLVGSVLAVAAIAVLACGAVWSYLTAQTQVLANDFDVALQTIEVNEEFDPVPTDEGWVKKRVRFTNTGDCPCFVRALIVPSVEDPSTSYEYSLDGWSEPDEDGWRYCSTAIEPQASTPYVLEGLTTHSTQSFDVYVLGESVQSDGFVGPQEAFAALRGGEPHEVLD